MPCDVMNSDKDSSLRPWILISWAGLIAGLSLMPAPPQAPGLLGWDKFQHGAAYAVLAWLLADVMARCRRFRSRHVWWSACLFTCLFGASMEVLQAVLPTGRTGEWLDLVADGLGALAACVIFRQTMKPGSRDVPA